MCVLELLRIEDETGHKTIKGQVWIQKMMYAASKTHPELDYGFEHHKYGMYSKTLKNILIDLNEKRLVCVDKSNERDQPIHLTAKGLEESERVSKRIDSRIQETLQTIKSILNTLRYNELVVLMYTKYPEMLENSEQKNEYEKWRENTAISMVQDDKVSFLLGFRMSGLSLEVFGTKIYGTNNSNSLQNGAIYADSGS